MCRLIPQRRRPRPLCWYQATCRRPDVCFVTGIPFCSACGESLDAENTVPEPTPGIPPIPKLPPDGKKRLSWPRFVHYRCDDESSSECSTVQGAPALPWTAAPVSQPSHAVYMPLQSTQKIRLLPLTRGNHGKLIHGTLISQPPKSLGNFTALSYTWADESGDNSRRKLIFLGEPWLPFKVTIIDQGNHIERNHQVRIMVDVYSSASKVFNKIIDKAWCWFALVGRPSRRGEGGTLPWHPPSLIAGQHWLQDKTVSTRPGSNQSCNEITAPPPANSALVRPTKSPKLFHKAS